MSENDKIDEMLNFDPLVMAEKLTGKSYKDDSDTSLLGMALGVRHNELKVEALSDRGDTHYSSTLHEQLKAFSDLGFEVVWNGVFSGTTFDGAPLTETEYILWHPLGVLAHCESHQKTHRNSAKIWYNWRPKEATFNSGEFYRHISSGSVCGGVWVGDHDAREALRHKFNNLLENGEFVNPWVKRPFLWLLNYVETKEDHRDYEAVNTQKIALLPQHVQDAIRGSSNG